MRMKRWFACILLCVGGNVWAGVLPPSVAHQVLNQIKNAAEDLNYTGVYLYQRDAQVDTYELVHIVDAKGVDERRESLDGPPKLMMRKNDDVMLFLPDAEVKHLKKNALTKLFPSLLPDDLDQLLGMYTLYQQANERVAGADAKVYELHPKDDLRHGYKFWVHPHTALLIKAAMQTHDGQLIEQFSFTQYQVHTKLSRDLLKPKVGRDDFAAYQQGALPKMQESATPNQAWEVRQVPLGFKLVKQAYRQVRQNAVSHWVFSDGLSNVSVFIAPVDGKPVKKGLLRKKNGAIAVKVVGSTQITVMGDVPDGTVLQLLEGIQPKVQR